MFKYAHLTCVLALSALALHAQSVPIASVETTGMVGIADAQTARINLLNPGIQPPATGAICSAHISFVDGDGNILKSGTLGVAPGKSAGMDLRSDTDLQLVAGDRREVRVVISIPTVPPPPTSAVSTPILGACTLVPTLEIFDTLSGRTLVTLGRTVAVPSVTK